LYFEQSIEPTAPHATDFAKCLRKATNVLFSARFKYIGKEKV